MAEPVVLPSPEVMSENAQRTLQRLLRVWFDFERRLARVPLVQRLERGRFSMADYRSLLLNLRPQVVEGSRWITRAASSFDAGFADVRSVVIGHAGDEHRDYELIEQDYAAAGGSPEELRSRARNSGTEALHGFLMYRAGRPNPVDMLGAMWIIEGLGNKMASEWAERIETSTGRTDHTRFLRYHADNDATHLNKLYALLDRVSVSEDDAQRIVTTAKVVGRLYALQLEVIDDE